MSVIVVTPPAEPLVSLALAKKQLRVDHSDDDDLISLQIAAAQATIDGPAGWLGRAIGEQTLELRQDGFYAGDWRMGAGWLWDGCWTGDAWSRWPMAKRIELPYPPLLTVESVTFEDTAGVDQVLTPQGWTSSDEGIEPAFGTAWPNGRYAANAVRVRYTAGYLTPPPPIVAAVLLMVGDLYANREASVIEVGKASVVENPTVASLLAPYRIWRV